MIAVRQGGGSDDLLQDSYRGGAAATNELSASDVDQRPCGDNAWGRWGDGDELGALNLVGSGEVLLASQLVRTGQVVALGQKLGPATPMASHRKKPERFMTRDGGDYAVGARRPDGFQFAEDVVSFSTHSATHVDSLAHVWSGDLLYNGFSASNIRSTTGASRCGVDKLRPIVTRGVLLDLTAVAGDSPSGCDQRSFGAEDLKEAVENSGLSLRPGDAVILHTGWMGRTGDDAGRYFAGEPGIDGSAARWLAEQGVAVVGADNYAVEVQPSRPGTTFPVHQILIRDWGIPLIENLLLDELVVLGSPAFLFIVSPLPIDGGTASPVNPVAVL